MSERRPLTSEALTELVYLSDPQLSADGRRAFCVRTVVDTPEHGPPRYRKQVCEVDLDAGSLRILAEGPEGADTPRPSPDGRHLAFRTKREGHEKRQVHLLDLVRGGEARPLTRLAAGARAFAWRPDGEALAVLGSDREPAPEGDAVVARTVTRMHYKSDGLPSPSIRTDPPDQAWLVPLPDGDPVPLSDFEAGVDDVAWAPDGRTLWLAAATDLAESDGWKASLWSVATDASGAHAEAPRRRLGPTFTPTSLAVSEDGRSLAWLAPSEAEQLASPTGLWTMNVDGSPVLRTGEVEATPSAGGDARYGDYPNRPVWWRDGWLVGVNQEGASGTCHVGRDGQLRPRISGPRVTSAFAHAAGRTLAVVETPQRPGELVLVEPDGSEKIVTDENGAFVERYGLVAGSTARRAPRGGDEGADAAGPGEETAAAEDGVAWWRLEPARPREDRAIVVQVHGGPHTNVGYGFYFEFQLLAARGYTVVSLNPRGSSSYGLDYRTSNLGGYGTDDADDVMSVVREAVRIQDDPSVPVHLTGGSYGGFMTNWLVTRTDRFRSAVTQRSICNWLSFYGTSDIGYRFAQHELEGNPWADTEKLWSQSPLAHVTNVTTPTLVIHAEADARCPVEQAEQWYVALMRIGRAETRFVRFADEGHELSRSGRPDRRVRRLDEIVDWFESHA